MGGVGWLVGLFVTPQNIIGKNCPFREIPIEQKGRNQARGRYYETTVEKRLPQTT